MRPDAAEIAAENIRLRRQNAALLEAAKPFVDYADRLEGWQEDAGLSMYWTDGIDRNPKLIDCRKLRDAVRMA